MSKTMKAAVMTAVNQPMEIQDIPIPRPGPGEVLVKIEVCGLCHSDLHFWKGDHAIDREGPVILGHEGIGTVVEIGSGVTRLNPGDRVGTGYIHATCGNCKECLTGQETHCASVECTGVNVDGCFAEYAVFRESWATRIPDRLEAAMAAPLLCAGVAAYSAVRKARLEPGELAVVFGAGGLGSYAIQIAKSHGARVAVVDVSGEKLDHAKHMGADHAIRADHDVVHEVQALGGANACFNFAPVAMSWRQMIETAAPRARLVLISLPNEALVFEAAEIIERGLQVMGSADGTRQELRQIMEIAELGHVRSTVTHRPLRDINKAFQDLASRDVLGRLVIDLTKDDAVQPS